MTKAQIILLIETTLNEKIKQDENYIRYSFYEVNVKYNLKDTDKEKFLEMLVNKLENNNYIIYKEGEQFEYENARMTVQCNEVIIAIKKKKEDVKNGNIHKTRNGIIKKSKRLYRK